MPSEPSADVIARIVQYLQHTPTCAKSRVMPPAFGFDKAAYFKHYGGQCAAEIAGETGSFTTHCQLRAGHLSPHKGDRGNGLSEWTTDDCTCGLDALASSGAPPQNSDAVRNLRELIECNGDERSMHSWQWAAHQALNAVLASGAPQRTAEGNEIEALAMNLEFIAKDDSNGLSAFDRKELLEAAQLLASSAPVITPEKS